MEKHLKKLLLIYKNIYIFFKKEILKIWILAFFLIIIWLIFAYPWFKEWLDNNRIPNINWKRNITFYIEKSSYNPYIWMRTDYNILFNYDKNKFIWKWEKWSVNNEILDFSLHDKINIDWTLSDKKINWIYTLEWKNRITNWNIEAVFDKNWKTFKWKFYWNWADVSWIITWKKE
jgi:hypothetical protein